MGTKNVEIEIPVGKELKRVDGENPQDVTERIKTFDDAFDILPSLKERDLGVIGSGLQCISTSTATSSVSRKEYHPLIYFAHSFASLNLLLIFVAPFILNTGFS